MKVTAISPHFIFEKPAGEETVEANRLANRLQEKSSRAESAHDSSSGQERSKENLDQETRDGLKRLLKLVKKSKEQVVEKESPSASSRLLKGVTAYRSAIKFDDSLKVRGALVNKKC